MIDGRIHGAEFRRCLLQLDVVGVMKLWKHVAPHLADQTPGEALTSLHIARVDAKSVPVKLKHYSRDWLAERGIIKVNGKWTQGPPVTVVAEAVGIAVKSRDPRVAKRIHRAMHDALLNGMAKGVTEPQIQSELMHKARMKERSKMAMA